MMIFDIIGALLYLAIAALLVGLVLQLASKLICKQAVEFGDAWRTAFFGLIGSRLVDAGLMASGLESMWFLELAVQFVLWTILISAVIGIDVVRAFAIAALMLALTWGILFVFGLILAFTLGLLSVSGLVVASIV